MRNSVFRLAILLSGCLQFAVLSAWAEDAGGDPAKGKVLYQKDCAKCHGKTGAGDGPMASGLEHKATNFTEKAAMAGKTDEQLFKATKEGGKAVGMSAEMPPYRKYSDQQVKDVVAYLKTLGK
jgi:mono/diheme cytochrome c family protein